MEQPLLVLGRNHSLNPLDSAPAFVRRCLLALVLGAVYCVVGYLIVIVVILFVAALLQTLIADFPSISLLDPMDYPGVVLLVLIPAVWLAYRTLLSRSQRRTDRCEFGAEMLTFIPRARIFGSARRSQESLTTVGNIEFVPPDRIRLDFGLETSDRLNRIVLEVAKETAEDDFERLESHLEEYVPEALYSVTEDGDARYSRRWTFEALFAWHQPISSLKLDLRGDDRQELTLSDTELCVSVQVVDEVILVRAEDPDEVAMRIDGAHIRDARGMVLGSHERTPFRVTVELGAMGRLEIQNDDGSVNLDGQMIGKIRTRKSVMRLDLLQPIPAPVALLALLAKRRDELF